MSKYPKSLVIFLPVLFSSSCAGTADRNLSPPSDTQWVNVEIKNPSQYTKPFPLEVVYVSHKCMKRNINGVDGSREEKPSYNGVKIPIQQQGNSKIWSGKVAINGGGTCDWRLSELNVGIEYIDATHLGQGLVPDTSVGATIVFNDFAAQNGKFENIVNNKFEYNPKYYPVIERWSEKKNATRPDLVTLFGKDGAFRNVYIRENKAQDIFVVFHPSIKENKIIEMKFPYEKTTGSLIKYIYPNGDIVETKDIRPDYNKVDSMNVKE